MAEAVEEREVGHEMEACSDEAGSKEAGTKDAGLAEAGSKEGMAEGEVKEACSDEVEVKEACSDEVEAKKACSDGEVKEACSDGEVKEACTNDGEVKEACTNDGEVKEACTDDVEAKEACTDDGEAKEACSDEGEAKEACSDEGGSRDAESKEADNTGAKTVNATSGAEPPTEKRPLDKRLQDLADTEPIKRFYTCKCFYSKNIFVPEYEMFVTFTTKAAFWRQYSSYFVSKGCNSEKFTNIVKNIEDEIKRRKSLGKNYLESKRTIRQLYKPLHPHVYKLQPSFLAPEFRELVEYCKSYDACFDGILQRVEEVQADRVYIFPVFTEDFCRNFLEELQHFESSDMPKGQPNSMNTYGVNLDELGCDEELISPLREDYLRPITALLYPDKGGSSLDSHKAFIVKYTSEMEPGLSLHFDNAEVTLNVCLGKDFTGGNLYLADMREEQGGESVEVGHRRGYGILHRGQQMHGAKPITAGERLNLILWMRCSYLRNKKCPMCNELPVLQETDGFGDGFTKEPSQMNFCSLA
uniref:2-oxoglutarate and iron-dependent oxygenase domain-containing protein 2 isoform X2 n=1 Tax=Petromyzon marinus TaxID=7757 RepID=A0AAJ7SQC9_PETMA|nr:2-oxoglutarate and iron-dependent oxygenase domain-containing protein 2 isoform X2 [Petromyzon marinus]